MHVAAVYDEMVRHHVESGSDGVAQGLRAKIEEVVGEDIFCCHFQTNKTIVVRSRRWNANHIRLYEAAGPANGNPRHVRGISGGDAFPGGQARHVRRLNDDPRIGMHGQSDGGTAHAPKSLPALERRVDPGVAVLTAGLADGRLPTWETTAD